MCWDVKSVPWRGFQLIVLVVDTTLIIPCMSAHGWGFVNVWCRSNSVSVFIFSLLNQTIFICFDVVNILAKSIKLDLPRISSWQKGVLMNWKLL